MLHLICPNPALDRTILMKDFKEGEVNRPYLVHENAGGKSFNVAYVLKKEAGGQSEHFTIHTMLGGQMGQYLLALNEQEAIPLTVTQVEKNTRTCTISIDSEKGKTYLVYEEGFELKPELLEAFKERLLSSLNDGDYVVFSGSLMKGMPASFIYDISTQLPSGVGLVVDTSGPALKEASRAKLDLLKINDEELSELVGQKLESPEQVGQVLKDYKDLPFFIVTMGAKGVVAKLEDDLFYLTFPAIQVKNPIASGDFFLGCLVHSLYEKGGIDREAVQRACAYATANCLEWIPQVTEDKLNWVLERIQITDL